MPNTQPSAVGQTISITADTTMSTILDLFSDTPIILEKKEIDVTPKVKKTRAKAVKPVKFEISKQLKEVLTYIKSVGTQSSIDICNAILEREFVGEDGLNYLGLAKDDNSKISYLDKARTEKYKDDVTIKKVIKVGSVFKYKKKKERAAWWHSETNPDLSYLEFKDCEISLKPTNLQRYKRSQGNVPVTFLEVEVFGEPDQEGFYNVSDLKIKFPVDYVTEAGSADRVPLYLFRSRRRNYSLDYLSLFYSTESLSFDTTNDYLFKDFKVSLKNEKVEKVWHEQVRYMSTPGKLVRKLLGSSISDNDLTAFSELFKEYSAVGVPGYTYKEESGEKIRENYLGDNYLEGSAGLNNSCMRYQRCQSFLDIYVKNPEVKLATLYYKNKVAGRGLLWQTPAGTYVDRLYYANNESENILRNLVRKYKSAYNISDLVEFPINKAFIQSLESVPYMDSLYYYDYDKEVLTNREPRGMYLFMRNQHGNIDIRGIRCSCCDRSATSSSFRDYHVLVDGEFVPGEDNVCEDCLVAISYNDSIYRVRTSDTICPDYGPRCMLEHVVTLFDGSTANNDPALHVKEYQNGYGLFWSLRQKFIKDPVTGLFYHPNDPNAPKIEEEEEDTDDIELFWDDL